MRTIYRKTPHKEEFQHWASFVNEDPSEEYAAWELADNKYSILSENEMRDIQEHLQERETW